MRTRRPKSRLKRLPIPALRGNLHVSVVDQTEVALWGDPEGLRSLAAVLIALADLDQTALDDLLEADAHEHLHLDARRHLGNSSARLILSRLDDKKGKLPFFYSARLCSSRPIQEYRRTKNV